MSEEDLSDSALQFIKQSRQLLIVRFADPVHYKSSDHPITIFMAGSPGAGKTEVSKILLKRFPFQAVRIDADQVRALCPGYTGQNFCFSESE